VDFFDRVSQLIIDTKGSSSGLGIAPDSSLMAYLPEIVLCATIVLLLIVRIFTIGTRLDRVLSWFGGSAFLLALLGTLVAFGAVAPWQHLTSLLSADAVMQDPAAVGRMEIFTGMLVYDTFTVFMRAILLLFVLLFVIFTRITGIPDTEDGADVYTLVLGATVGMCLMASANHLLTVFLAVEMASVPSYALVGLMKGRRKASEAALKYAIYGAGAAGVMLYGISLIAGVTNTVHLPSLAVRLAELDLGQMIADGQSQTVMVLAIGTLMFTVGLAFKLSAFPFHFWCPDVFEGATAEVDAFLSVASKAAALALLVRVSIGLGALAPGTEPFDQPVKPGQRTALLAAQETGSEVAGVASPGSSPQSASLTPGDSDQFVALVAVQDEPAASEEAAAADPAANDDPTANDDPAANDASAAADASPPVPGSMSLQTAIERLGPSREFFSRQIAFLALLTCTFGNLAAYGQTNIKRLLAYSTIAHAGYMMMAVPAMLAMASVSSEAAQTAVAGLAIYLFVYLFMNLGAFAIVAFLRNEMRSEEIADYAGLIRRCPFYVISLAAIMFSLVGLPPLAGFIGKFAVFAALANGYQLTSQSYLLWLLVVGGINTAISLFYYLRVVKVMTMDDEPEQRTPFSLPFVSLPGLFVMVVTLPTVILILNWDDVSQMATIAASKLLM
jgi:NADH-quinone oxidoreductase subunit N